MLIRNFVKYVTVLDVGGKQTLICSSIKTVMEIFEKFSNISGMKTSNDKLKVSKIGGNINNTEIEYLKSIGIN